MIVTILNIITTIYNISTILLDICFETLNTPSKQTRHNKVEHNNRIYNQRLKGLLVESREKKHKHKITMLHALFASINK